MTLVMTLLVRDEEDILDQHLSFHLSRGVDVIVVTDNRSVDGTRDILESYRRQGVLHIIVEPDDTYDQSVWVTRMARLAATGFGADWVINSDADEFWWPERDPDLKAVLERVPAGTPALQVRRADFAPRPAAGGLSFLETMVYRKIAGRNALGQPLPPKVCHRASAEVTVLQGNHGIRTGRRTNLGAPTSDLSILHFPVRTLGQLTRKIANGGAAYARSRLPPDVGGAWRYLYAELLAGRLDDVFARDLVDDSRLAQALDEQVLVEDRRLLQYFRDAGLRC